MNINETLPVPVARLQYFLKVFVRTPANLRRRSARRR
jgi:hypothetical protein